MRCNRGPTINHQVWEVQQLSAGTGREDQGGDRVEGEQGGDRVHPPESRHRPHQQVETERKAESMGNDHGAAGVGTTRARQNSMAVDGAERSGSREDCSGVKDRGCSLEHLGAVR